MEILKIVRKIVGCFHRSPAARQNQLVLLLGPFEEFSREFERKDATIGLIIPGVRNLLKHLGKPVETEESSVVKKCSKSDVVIFRN